MQPFLLSSLHRERMGHYFLSVTHLAFGLALANYWSQVIIGATAHIYNFISVFEMENRYKIAFWLFLAVRNRMMNKLYLFLIVSFIPLDFVTF